MILYKNIDKMKYKERPIRTMNIKIEEKPSRPVYDFKSNKERYKYCTMVKNLVRKVPEYRDYVSFLKKKMGMGGCDVYRDLDTSPESGKRYTIELHHTPYTLMEIVNVVLQKRIEYGETLNPNFVAEEILDLHYSGKVGLINLSKTAHELAENGRIFIPLQRIRHRGFIDFTNEYENFMDDKLKEKIELIIQMSQNCPDIVSDCLDTEFVYINIDGFDFPEVPEEWGNALKDLSIENSLKDEESEKENGTGAKPAKEIASS